MVAIFSPNDDYVRNVHLSWGQNKLYLPTSQALCASFQPFCPFSRPSLPQKSQAPASWWQHRGTCYQLFQFVLVYIRDSLDCKGEGSRRIWPISRGTFLTYHHLKSRQVGLAGWSSTDPTISMTQRKSKSGHLLTLILPKKNWTETEVQMHT